MAPKKEERIDKAKTLAERNDKDDAFRDDRVEQAQRDQLVMPVDDVPDELVEKREENERDKRGTYGPKDL